MSDVILAINNVVARYGQIEALRGVSLTVGRGEAVALVGANGAGKSTLMKCIMGLLPCAEGSIEFDGVRLGAVGIHDRAALGIGYSPEGRRIFPGLTVQENLLVASTDRDGGRARADEVYQYFPALRTKAAALGWSLSGGQQQMLAVARALMIRPKLLLLDEPSLGLAPILMTEVLNRVRDITASGTAVLLAEQNVHKALAVSEQACVIRLGRIVDTRPSCELLAEGGLTNAFLGA
ncbi:MAG: ABC transporter ATP-binding protein [Variovorax sp.]